MQYEYEITLPNNNNKMTLGVRYTDISYTPKSGGETVGASGGGIVMGFIF